IPYWKFTDSGREVILLEHHVSNENEIPQIISDRDISVDALRFIEADLVYYPSGSCAFVLSWNHILLDAKGTTLLFDHLNQVTDNAVPDTYNFFPGKEQGQKFISYIRNM